MQVQTWCRMRRILRAQVAAVQWAAQELPVGSAPCPEGLQQQQQQSAQLAASHSRTLARLERVPCTLHSSR